MNLVNVNPRYRRVTKRPSFATPVFDNLFNELFNGDFAGPAKNSFTKKTPTVNVIESKENFRIEVAAPGLEKKDFNLSVEKDQLLIEASKKEEKENKEEKFTKREFNYAAFKRSFYLPETVDASKIGASYENGILNITLPKVEEAKAEAARSIKIS